MTEQSSILRPQLRDLAPYNAGLTLDEVARRAGTTRVAKLASNENPHGCSDPVRAAMTEAISRPHLYPDHGGRALAQAVAETPFLFTRTEDACCALHTIPPKASHQHHFCRLGGKLRK